MAPSQSAAHVAINSPSITTAADNLDVSSHLDEDEMTAGSHIEHRGKLAKFMSQRLIEVFLPEQHQKQVTQLLKDQAAIATWLETRWQDQLWVRLLVDATEAETVIDLFATQFEGVEGFRLLLLEVEASLPLTTREEQEHDPEAENLLQSVLNASLKPQSSRINREEIYDRVFQSADLSWVQLSLIVLSTVIAAIGIVRDNQAVVIGAMVIAPLLQPNMALAVATTLGDKSLAYRTLRTGSIGILLALLLAVAIGYVVPVSLESSEIASRVQVRWPDGILAFASGVAGAIALTSEERSGIVGVMVSVALLPPLVVAGLLLGAAEWSSAFGASLLTLTNVICLNLAAVTTFLIQDLRPRQLQAQPQAEQVTQAAISIWLLLLMALVGVVLANRFYDLNLY
ncbi:MAG: TIGR00341 family protein [Leptolyngbyaceae cyanobacterium]